VIEQLNHPADLRDGIIDTGYMWSVSSGKSRLEVAPTIVALMYHHNLVTKTAA
jgi:hypothetical protein